MFSDVCMVKPPALSAPKRSPAARMPSSRERPSSATVMASKPIEASRSVETPLVTAMLGGEVTVDTLGGPVQLTIPPETPNGRRFRLKSKGMSVLRATQRGDMYVQAVVETPVNLNKKQQELLREFEKAGKEGTSPESEGFFAKVKELWEDLKD